MCNGYCGTNTTIDYDFQPGPHPLQKRIACTPFPAQAVEKEFRNGVAIPKQKGTLTRLEVVFTSTLSDNEVLVPGNHVHVRSEHLVSPWAKEVFEVDGKRFILVPEAEIILIDPSTQEK